MWKQLWALSVQSEDMVNIFVLALFVLLAKVAVKYVTKLPVICSETPTPGSRRAAHFDCLRLPVQQLRTLLLGLKPTDAASKNGWSARKDSNVLAHRSGQRICRTSSF
jgi:hypothetical protein